MRDVRPSGHATSRGDYPGEGERAELVAWVRGKEKRVASGEHNSPLWVSRRVLCAYSGILYTVYWFLLLSPFVSAPPGDGYIFPLEHP